MECRYCHESVRLEGLTVISNSDDEPVCPNAPLDDCSRCKGKGCGSCEGYGQVFGPHAL